MQAFAELNPEFIHFVDLGSAFLGDELAGGKKDVSEALMPDSLHPSSGARGCPRTVVVIASQQVKVVQPECCPSVSCLERRHVCIGD